MSAAVGYCHLLSAWTVPNSNGNHRSTQLTKIVDLQKKTVKNVEFSGSYEAYEGLRVFLVHLWRPGIHSPQAQSLGALGFSRFDVLPITNPAIEARGEKHRCSLGFLNTENQRISESGGIPKKAHHIEYNWLEFLRPFWKPASGYPAKELKDYTGNLLPIPVKRLTPMIGPTSPRVTALANTPLCVMQNLAPKWRV